MSLNDESNGVTFDDGDAPVNTMTFEPPAKVSSRAAAERVRHLRDTIAMLRKLGADAVELRRAAGDIYDDLDAEAGEAADNVDLEMRVALVADLLDQVGVLLDAMTNQLPTALDELDAADVAELERRLAGRSRGPRLDLLPGRQ